jgi:hypothetical protein
MSITMQELELETAELLPARETLGVCRHPGGSSSNFSFSQVVGSGNGNHDGNGNVGLIVISGNGDGNGNGNALLGGLIG